jgi:hypothetical protein
MSPTVRNVIARFPLSFSPVDYTWLDLSFYEPPPEGTDELLKFVGCSKLIDIPISEYPLPFESLATVNFLNPLEGEEIQEPSPVVATLDRDKNKLLYKLYLPSIDEAAVIGEFNGDAKQLRISFGKKYGRMAVTNGISTTELLDMQKKVTAYILRKVLVLGVRPDPIVVAGRPTGDATKNAKRKRKGKLQFWEWKTIELKPMSVLPSAALGGTHASPKPHERVGHWRQYKSGKKIFIKAHIVNKHKIETDGFVFHDYVKH